MSDGKMERPSGVCPLDPGPRESTDQKGFRDRKVPGSEPHGSCRSATMRSQRKMISPTADMTKPDLDAPGLVFVGVHFSSASEKPLRLAFFKKADSARKHRFEAAFCRKCPVISDPPRESELSVPWTSYGLQAICEWLKMKSPSSSSLRSRNSPEAAGVLHATSLPWGSGTDCRQDPP